MGEKRELKPFLLSYKKVPLKGGIVFMLYTIRQILYYFLPQQFSYNLRYNNMSEFKSVDKPQQRLIFKDCKRKF